MKVTYIFRSPKKKGATCFYLFLIQSAVFIALLGVS
jgi:hypothetical protein